jgi:glyoxylase-like metal-dependent hydrolase (beta-lactamase superfamily II)
MITTLKYGATNTYAVRGKNGILLFDTGWAGTFPLLCRSLGENGLRLQDIKLLLISHFHPDHMGIAQEIANAGVTLAAADVQRDHLHFSDDIFARDKCSRFVPIDDTKVRFFTIGQSRELLGEVGIDGEIIHTPGHSDDSISLWVQSDRTLLVGDLNPLYELEMHKGTQIEQSWQKLLSLKPQTICYAHAKAAVLDKTQSEKAEPHGDNYALVKKITKLADKGFDAHKIADRTGADIGFVQDVQRMYFTHPNVSVQGILDRIEIKGK